MFSELDLLTGLPKLTALHCALLPGMEALIACRTLRDLTLQVELESRDAAVDGAAALLREAGQLRHVGLVFNREASSVAIAAKLLRALGASGQSSVHTLSINFNNRDCSRLAFNVFGNYGHFLNYKVLLSVLPRLPVLRELSLDYVPDELVPNLSPTTAPALRMLHSESWVPCCHEWLHSDTIRKIPHSIHVRLEGPFCSDCNWCYLDCHEDVKDFLEDERDRVSGTSICFYSHPNDQCSAPDLHTSNDDKLWWIRVPRSE
ncbi:uncharacterized protein LOC113211090 isoform X1 [Frankliniella occidentalis]|uniref:Uncharacterized protein LOC113211090 isoform X1 n=1 Tax=Frankliniella occidentalis TaxID=133901 RepID=A0A9C6WRC6_FRAOC|nr:uncharacterized protein LOC113211090 isoform X1 [Frankliniella occidentalis]